ncbi:hypothetical protein B0T18DRAFT_428300 [Schizothecium vesticola]|uniref:Uncharacterized protein n=1 Tax=Schizothecium vesticola TaxID=314040 RepID=A0AA40F3D6_9PEZI|nr:hypothetical protein B0T18DRAFT_428300 [Schizothecium vesticola]
MQLYIHILIILSTLCLSGMAALLDFYELPDFKGTKHSIDPKDLEPRACVNLPKDTKVSSVQFTKSPETSCCLLYRSPCLPNPLQNFTQAPGFLHQRIHAPIPSLAPFGWTDVVRSTVCLGRAACDGMQMDEREAGGWNLAVYWVDVKDLERAVWI